MVNILIGNSLVHTSSRIIQNDGYVLDFSDNNGGVHRNKKCLKEFLVNYDYNNLSKFFVVNYIENRFTDYIDSIGRDRNGIVLNDDKKDFLVNFPIKYCERYRDKVARRMKFLCSNNGNKDCVFLTLTLDPKLYDSFVDMWLEIKKELNRFMTRLKIELKNKKRSDIKIKYLSSIECQKGTDVFDKEGNSVKTSWFNPHIHIVFIGLKRLMDWKKIRDYWKLGHIWINRTNDGKRIRKPIDYLTKYITKTYDETNRDNIRDQAFQWFFCIRSFSYSKGLVYPLNYNNFDGYMVCSIYCDNFHIYNWVDSNLNSVLNNFRHFDGG